MTTSNPNLASLTGSDRLYFGAKLNVAKKVESFCEGLQILGVPSSCPKLSLFLRWRGHPSEAHEVLGDGKTHRVVSYTSWKVKDSAFANFLFIASDVVSFFKQFLQCNEARQARSNHTNSFSFGHSFVHSSVHRI